MRREFQTSMQAWRRVSVLLAIIVLCAGCSSLWKAKQVIVLQHDTTTVHHRDSIYQRDSIYIREWTKGDTVYIDRWRDRLVWRDRWRDSVSVKTDTVAVERIKEVKVEKPLSWWKRVKIALFPWLLIAAAGLLVWTFRKFIFKL